MKKKMSQVFGEDEKLLPSPAWTPAKIKSKRKSKFQKPSERIHGEKVWLTAQQNISIKKNTSGIIYLIWIWSNSVQIWW